ncbi:MAG: hypothetical protein RI894_1966 [Bacteroidota bacterium]|jgi:hypothetical protein
MKQIVIFFLVVTCLLTAASSGFAQPKPHRPKPAVPAPHGGGTAAVQQPATIATFEQLVKAGIVYARQCATQNEKQWHLGIYQNGGFRNEAEHTLVKNDSANNELKIHYTELGFYFPDKKEWSWIWWNNPNAEAIKEYGRTHQIKELTTEFLTLENTVDAIKLAQAAAFVLKARGIEAIPSPDGSHFWLIAYDSIN